MEIIEISAYFKIRYNNHNTRMGRSNIGINIIKCF